MNIPAAQPFSIGRGRFSAFPLFRLILPAFALALFLAGCGGSGGGGANGGGGGDPSPGATLVSLSVTPATVNVPQGYSQQFIAMGTYSDGSVANLTATAVWATSDPAMAAISANGQANGTAAGGPVTISAALDGVNSNSAALTVTAPLAQTYAYAANSGSNDVSAYVIDAARGTLVPIDADPATPGVQNFPAGSRPYSLTVAPGGLFAYAANISGGISAYVIDAARGTLTPIDADPVTPGVQNFPAGSGSTSVTVEPGGRFAYAANQNGNNISAYVIDAASGALFPIDADPATAGVQNFPAGSGSTSVTVAPGGRFAYVANYFSANVSAYVIDAASGALIQIDADLATPGIQNFPAGVMPSSITTEPGGCFAYVANRNSSNLSAYLIDANSGALIPIDADTATPGVQNFPAGTAPSSVTVSPDGRFAYADNFSSNDVSAYLIDSVSGALIPIDADTATTGVQNFPAGTGAASVMVSPDSRFAYVANITSNDLSAYMIDTASGALIPIDADTATLGVQNFPAGTMPHSISTWGGLR